MKLIEVLEVMNESKERYEKLIKERGDNIKFVENKKKAIIELEEKITVVEGWIKNKPRPDQFFTVVEKEIISGYGINKTEFVTIQTKERD